jgi:short-subunit dehydrogenase
VLEGVLPPSSGAVSEADHLERSDQMKLHDRVVLITGASRGIGAAVASAVVAKGAVVGLIARTGRDLEEVLGQLGHRGAAATADVADRAALAEAIATLETELGPIDVLVANAGIGAYGPFANVEADEMERLVEVNVLGTMYAIRHVLPAMIARRNGHIVTIGSIAGRIGSPFEAVYSATKFAAVGLTEALAVEVEPYDIGVSVVNPGPVASSFGAARGHPYDRDRPKPVAPAAVADAVVDAIEHDKRELYVPPWFRPAVVMRHLMPPMLRWGTRRSFRDQLAADRASR